MRTVRRIPTLILGAGLALGLVAPAALAQEARPDPATPTAATLTYVTLGTEDVRELGVLVPSGYRLAYRSHGQTRSDDPRLVGEFRNLTVMDSTRSNELDRYSELLRIETPDGAWQGSGIGHISVATASEVAMLWLTGEGAYDGLSLVVTFSGPAMERHDTEHPDSAIIWTGPAPEAPDAALLDG